MVSENDIKLLFVPVEGIGDFQPPDGRIFAELKTAARAKFIRILHPVECVADYDFFSSMSCDYRTQILTENVKKI
jgi:hypothetical protein